MPTYAANVSASSGPTNVGMKIDTQDIPMGRAADGSWNGIGTVISSKNPVPFEFRAVGVAGFPVNLKITLTPSTKPPYSKNFIIPGSLLLIVDDTVPV
jgi:hypothetical protein